MMFTDVLKFGRKVNNFLDDATSNWDTTTTHKFIVPAGKRWLLLGGNGFRSDAATVQVYCFNTANKKIFGLTELASAAGRFTYPSRTAEVDSGAIMDFMVLDAGEYVNFVFGAAQGATAYISCVVIEWAV